MLSEGGYIAWAERNRLKNREYQRVYYAKNKIRIRKRQNEKSKIKGNRRGISNPDYREIAINLLFSRDGTNCGECGLEIEIGKESIDHKLPRCMGGTNEASNVRLLHRRCNHIRPRGHKKWNGKEIKNVQLDK